MTPSLSAEGENLAKLPPQFYLKLFFNFSHKRPTFAFTSESGYTLGFAQRIAHNGSHAETGGISDGALSLPSTRTARSRTSPVRVPERRALPLLGLGPVCFRRTQRAFGTAMRLCASLFRRHRGPAGLRDLFSHLQKLQFSCPTRSLLHLHGMSADSNSYLANYLLFQ